MIGTALITGASSGIGLELARIFAADKWDVALVARSEGKLRELASELQNAHGVRARVIAADLAKPSAPDEIMAALEGVEIDALVNNAGFGLGGEFVKADLHTELEMIQVNITALTHLTSLVLPSMVARRRGAILNVASTPAFQPGPFMSVYYATKAYVLSFSEAIVEELTGSGVTVTALCPRAYRDRLRLGGERRGVDALHEDSSGRVKGRRPRGLRGDEARQTHRHPRHEEQAARTIDSHLAATSGYEDRAEGAPRLGARVFGCKSAWTG
jgi:hypothetical protein